MNTRASSVLALAFMSFGLTVVAHAASNDTAQIRALEDRLAAAVNARNVDAIMKAYVPDESLFVFDVIPPRQYVGAKAFRKDWDEFLGATKGPLKYDIKRRRCRRPRQRRLRPFHPAHRRNRPEGQTDRPHHARH
jgi:hypothetical protein